VTAADGTVKAGMEAKYRQIHRFVEIVRPLLAEAGIGPEDPVRLTDMGCGKGYLTFAIHDHLRRTRPPGVEVEVRGVEARNELATLCRAVAERCGREGLDFVAGDIAGASVPGGGVLVALHACDTATDEALAKGVAARAALLLVSPCCHREVRQRLVPPPVLAGALGHGIFRERQAEFATDALRAALLEWAGYDTRVFEFVATEHTAKNLMIAAVRRRGPFDREARAGEAARLAAFYGITAQRLADLLGFPLGGSASAAA
jgi:SAM-dependent methyltransferase